MGITDDNCSAVGNDRRCKLRRGEHGAFDVDMAVDQAGREVTPSEVNTLFSLVLTYAGNVTVQQGNIILFDFSTEDVNDLTVA